MDLDGVPFAPPNISPWHFPPTDTVRQTSDTTGQSRRICRGRDHINCYSFRPRYSRCASLKHVENAWQWYVFHKFTRPWCIGLNFKALLQTFMLLHLVVTLSKTWGCWAHLKSKLRMMMPLHQ